MCALFDKNLSIIEIKVQENKFKQKPIKMNFRWRNLEGSQFNLERSFSETDVTILCSQIKDRFAKKHPYEYVSLDCMKHSRRKMSPAENFHTKSEICLYDEHEPVLSYGSLKTEYKRNYNHYSLILRPKILRRSTSLHLKGPMNHISENQDQFRWLAPKDLKECIFFPIKDPGTNKDRLDNISSLPNYSFKKQNLKILQRNVLSLQQESAHKQLITTEYKQQFIKFPVIKPLLIHPLCHLKLEGDFTGVTEYMDKYKIYANYLTSCSNKNMDNLLMSGTKVPQTLKSNSNYVITKEKKLKFNKNAHHSNQFKNYFGRIQQNNYINIADRLQNFQSDKKKPDSSFCISYSPNLNKTIIKKFEQNLQNNQKYENNITCTPEYRRAHYIYQIREHIKKKNNVDERRLAVSMPVTKKCSDTFSDTCELKYIHRRRRSKYKSSSKVHLKQENSFDSIGSSLKIKPDISDRKNATEEIPLCELKNRNKQKTFAVLEDSCKNSNWMKISWYES